MKSGCSSIVSVATVNEIFASALDFDSDKALQIIAVSANCANIMGLSVNEGRFVSPHGYPRKNPVCAIGEGLRRRLEQKGLLGNYIRILGQLKDYKRKGSADNKTVMSIRDYNEIVFLPSGMEWRRTRDAECPATENFGEQISEMIVQISNSKLVFEKGEIIKRILEVAHNGVSDFPVMVPKALLRQAWQTQRTFNLVLATIAGISLLVGGSAL